MNLYPVYRASGKAPPKWLLEVGAALVCLVGVPALIACHYVSMALEDRS